MSAGTLGLVGQLLPVLAQTGSAAYSFLGARKSQQSAAQLDSDYKAAAELEARAMRIAALRRRGAVRALAAKGGVDPNRGTPADVLAENAYWDELNAQVAAYNTSQRAQRARLEAEAFGDAQAFSGTTTLLDLATRSLRGLGPSPEPLPVPVQTTPLPDTPVGPNTPGYRIPR